MADTFRIYKDDEVIVEGVSPLAITGVAPNTEVSSGTYRATRLIEGKESAKVDIPAFKTLPINVTGVTLNKSSISLEVGASETLIASVAPENATDKGIVWTTSNSTFATVTNGKVVAVGQGLATITATTKDGAKTAKCTVTISSVADNIQEESS